MVGGSNFFFIKINTCYLPVFGEEMKHIRHKAVATAYIEYSSLEWQQLMELPVVGFQFCLYAHIPFQHRPFVNVIVDELLPEVCRGFCFFPHPLILFPKIAGYVFGALGIAVAPTAVPLLY